MWWYHFIMCLTLYCFNYYLIKVKPTRNKEIIVCSLAEILVYYMSRVCQKMYVVKLYYSQYCLAYFQFYVNLLVFPIITKLLNCVRWQHYGGQHNCNTKNEKLVPSVVTSSFHTQQTPEHHQQQHQNQQVVTALNGNAMTGCALSPVASNPNPNAGMNSVALHRTLSVPGMDQSTEQLQSMHSNASSFPNYTGLTIPNQSEY